MDHAVWPVGPVGKPTEFHVCFPMLAMSYTPRGRQGRADGVPGRGGQLPTNGWKPPKNTIFREAAKSSQARPR